MFNREWVADPASVAFDAVSSAVAQGVDVVIMTQQEGCTIRLKP